MSEMLRSFKKQFDHYLTDSLSKWKERGKLYDACEYALLNGGKRVRPSIVMMIAKALGRGFDVREAALSVEFFHTSSLIADDLPCMDNDDYRRDKPSLHKVFGETVALLASYSLITEGFSRIHSGAEVFSTYAEGGDHICSLALECASKGAGITGATGGQFLDLFPKKLSIDSIREVIEKKTITLFEVAFVFGWLFGGGDVSLLFDLKKAAYHFGMAFQIADDLDDLDQDCRAQKSPNIALFLGAESAYALFQEELAGFEDKMKKLRILSPEFQELISFLSNQVRAGSSTSGSMP